MITFPCLTFKDTLLVLGHLPRQITGHGKSAAAVLGAISVVLRLAANAQERTLLFLFPVLSPVNLPSSFLTDHDTM